MIVKRLKYLAVCLLVLLSVVSTMGGNNDGYKYYRSEDNSSLCLSFRSNRLTDCCKQDDMQRIYVQKTGRLTGIFHVKNFRKVLCYNQKKMRFRLYRGKNLGLKRCRHQRRREREHRRRVCTLTETEKNYLKSKGCELYDYLTSAGYAYISYKRNERYLGLRRGRVQRHKQVRGQVKEPKGKRFLLISENHFDKYPLNCNAGRA